MRTRTVMAAAMALTALGGCSRAGEPSASGAWVRLAAVPGRPAAGYFTLHGGAKAETLTGVSARGVPRIELHESRDAGNGATTMDATPSVTVPAGGTVSFAPGGRHAMLFDVPAAVKPGATLSLTLAFASGQSVDLPAKVVGAGEDKPD